MWCRVAGLGSGFFFMMIDPACMDVGGRGLGGAGVRRAGWARGEARRGRS